MALDQQCEFLNEINILYLKFLVYRGDDSTSYIDKTSPSYSNERMKDDDELNYNGLFSSSSTRIDDLWFDSNVVKSINEQVNSVRPFIESITMDEDHVVPRRSIFQMVIHGSKSSFPNKTRFSPV
jgi:hypothetical protein